MLSCAALQLRQSTLLTGEDTNMAKVRLGQSRLCDREIDGKWAVTGESGGKPAHSTIKK